jgi:hypothetical protein
MTSRDPSERRTWDQLDTMIRWSLRESLEGVTPPPGVWNRIRGRLLQEGRTRWARCQRGFRLGANAVILSLIGSVADARSGIRYPALAACSGWKGECLCWADEYGILLRRLAVL